MNLQIFGSILFFISVYRFFKGFVKRKQNIDVFEEIGDFVNQIILTLVMYFIVYGVITLFN